MKKRKFQDGGDVDDKRRGLEVSAGEKVGFLKRLRMGNIDDPKSEAYRQFGAGRGATVVRGNTEDDAASLEKTGGFGKAALDEAAKRPTYKASTAAPEAQTSTAKTEDAKPKNFRQAFAAARKAGDKTFMFGGKKFTTELKEEVRKPTKAEPAKAEPAKVTPPSKPRISQARGSMKEKMREMGVTRYKSGGSVKSSASKRADGCAVRGKTKGRMV